ncbi:McrC family protein [Oceanobacillus caeni]|uniref:McrC family protein n=1 Tax=Oceanobacillus caeni TaxID=405946 RepID=UPI001C23A7F0|nr:McrC family protein [Oceanobacillus caeni]MBU8792466.1 McrC family protein [Oceanobacillus caeni]
MKNITIREAFDWLHLDDNHSSGLTNVEWEHLLQFLDEKYKGENIVEIGIHRLRFINLVGIIQLKTVRIEILPKLDENLESNSFNRRSLLNMLRVTKQLPVQLNNRTTSEFEKVDLSHLLAYLFVTEMYKTLRRGLYRSYEQKTDNLKHLKGRLLVSQHIKKNVYQSVNAYCEFDELSTNVPLNQVLKAALKIIKPFVKQGSLHTQMWMIFEMLDEVDDLYGIEQSFLDSIEINRQNQHYEGVLQLAIAIIQSTIMSSGVSKQIAFSYLFKMNDLYEAYVGECLKKLLAPTFYKVDLQHQQKRLLVNVFSGRENISLKPDFVVSRMEQNEQIPIMILDTKWKSIFTGSRLNYNQGDIYQMYAYITAYKTAQRCIILYPALNEQGLLPKWLVPDTVPEKYIEMKMIRLDDVDRTLEDLEEVLVLYIEGII